MIPAPVIIERHKRGLQVTAPTRREARWLAVLALAVAPHIANLVALVVMQRSYQGWYFGAAWAASLVLLVTGVVGLTRVLGGRE